MIFHYLKNNDCYKKGDKIRPSGIVIHSTGCNQKKISVYVKSWNRSGLNKCVHAFIGLDDDGNVETVKTLPWNFKAWHVGCGKKGSANATHIGIEICEDDKKDQNYLAACYAEAVSVCASLCSEYNLNPLGDGVILGHSEAFSRGIGSNHSDPVHWFTLYGYTMDEFRKDVKKAMRYKTLEDIPDYYKDAIILLISRGILRGDGNSLDLSEDMCRTLTLLYRAGVFGG